MKYILDKRYRLRGWKGLPTGLYDTERKQAKFLQKDKYLFLMRCDGAHDLDETQLTEQEKKFLEDSIRSGVIHDYDNYDCLHNYHGYHCDTAHTINCDGAFIPFMVIKR